LFLSVLFVPFVVILPAMPSECDIEIRVRYAETDRMGYVHHSRYFVYFEMGRTELLRAAGVAYRDLEDAGVFFVVAKLAARFIAPARYDDVLVLTTTIKRLTTARIDHVYALRRKATGELLTEAESTLACVGAEGQIIPIPDFVRRGCGGP
jgi:acyl-CoA thioester hydrolase